LGDGIYRGVNSYGFKTEYIEKKIWDDNYSMIWFEAFTFNYIIDSVQRPVAWIINH
jgi:hypothetical protein